MLNYKRGMKTFSKTENMCKNSETNERTYEKILQWQFFSSKLISKNVKNVTIIINNVNAEKFGYETTQST